MGPTHEEVALNLRIFKEVCTMIVIPLSTEKKLEPGTTMDFMRITVNAEHIEARLPQNKMFRMLQLLIEFQNKTTSLLVGFV